MSPSLQQRLEQDAAFREKVYAYLTAEAPEMDPEIARLSAADRRFLERRRRRAELVERWREDAEYRAAVKANPAAAVRAHGIRLSAAEQEFVRQRDPQRSDEELYRRARQGAEWLLPPRKPGPERR